MHQQATSVIFSLHGCPEKCRRDERIIQPLDKVIVAFSGGVDSTLLLKVCLDALGRDNVLAFIGASPIHPERETTEAINIAQQLGADYVVVQTTEMNNTDFTSNPREVLSLQIRPS